MKGVGSLFGSSPSLVSCPFSLHPYSLTTDHVLSAAKMVAATCIVEDPTGRAEFFSVYNLPLPGIETGPDLDALLPLAVREPTFKPNQDGRGHLIRIDSPSDLVFLQPDDPLLRGVTWTFPSPAKPLPSSFDHKARGNALWKQKKYLLAVKAYTNGLSAASTDEQKLLL
jgi:hypothetical protein